MKKIGGLLFLLIVGILPKVTEAQGRQEVALKKYTQDDGLSTYYITKILQDSKGFLWVATQEGLNRFDGRNFVHFTKTSDAHHRLGGISITEIIEDKKRNMIWVASALGDICGIDANTFTIKKRITHDIHQKPFSAQWIRCLALQNDTMWIGLATGVHRYNLEKDIYLSEPAITSGTAIPRELHVSNIFIDPYDRSWIMCDGYGIIVLDKQRRIITQFNNEKNKKPRFWEFADVRGKIYIGTSDGLKAFGYNANEIRQLDDIPPALANAEVLSVTASDKNIIWASTANNFYRYDIGSGGLSIYNEIVKQKDDWFSSVFQSFYDSSMNRVWIGTQGGLGSFSASPSPFSSFFADAAQTMKISHAHSLLPLSDSIVYCGSENGLFLVDTKKHVIEKISDGSLTLLLFKDRLGNIFVSNKNGTFLLKNKKLFPVHITFPSLAALETDQLHTALQFNDSLILFGGILQKGLYVWNTRSGQLTSYHEDSAHAVKGLSIIHNLYRSSTGRVLILTENEIIGFDPLSGKYANHHVLNPGTADRINNFMDIHETAKSYWIATYGNGLIETDKQFNVKKILSKSSELANDCVYKIIPYREGMLMATTNYGLSVINTKTYSIHTYYRSDGLQDNGFEQLCAASFNGIIYAGGVNGFTRIDPNQFRVNNNPPRLYINRLFIERTSGFIDTTDVMLTHFEVPNNAKQTTIYFSGINFSNPERTRFRYKIPEMKYDWTQLSTNNSVNLTAVEPGTYTLVVQAANENDVLSDEYFFKLTFKPRWYQTIWFKLLLGIAVLSIGYAIYRIRIAQLKKEHTIRTKLASDLHDDLGGTLNSIKLYAHLAINEPKEEHYLQNITNGITEAIAGVRDILWVLDDKKDNLDDVVIRISQFAQPLCNAQNIKFTSSISDDARFFRLKQNEKRNLYMILKEAINNSTKYSAATQITLNISLAAKQPVISIADNGKGFDVNSSPAGNGLKNMKFRTAEIKYDLEILSGPSTNGTIIILKKR